MADHTTSGEAGVKTTGPGKPRKGRSRLRRWFYASVATTLGSVLVGGIAAFREARYSDAQSRYFSAIARGDSNTKAKDPDDPAIELPQGPYDKRLGYVRTREIRRSLEAKGYRLAEPMKPWMEREVLGLKLNPIYNEKSQTGLTMRDDADQPLYTARFPRRIYPDFSSVPPLLVDSLLFVENRELLGEHPPEQNPAIEWDRFALAVVDNALKKIGAGGSGAGGSTLATQLEKLRHSPGGQTHSPPEKIRQMISASVRNYQDDTDTREERRQIVTDYLNSMPLAAYPGFGEVVGFADGMTLWFGADFDDVNRLLSRSENEMNEAEFRAFAETYRAALTLIMAVQRPSELQGNRDILQERIDKFLPFMAEKGVISQRLLEAALAARVQYAAPQKKAQLSQAPEEKSVETLRNALLAAVGEDSLYDLDQMDLSVESTIDGAVSAAITAQLKSFNDPQQAVAAGIAGPYPLMRPDMADKVIFSFTLYEKGSNGVNYLRVQTDNFDGALNLNEGSKLELGSTAKLRTLVSYLEAVAELHAQYAGSGPRELQSVAVSEDDRITRWALQYLSEPDTDKSLEAMLDAAMDRTYSASPGEAFFTGGGLHRFHNFKREDGGRVISVREAFENSVNLPFVRIMRDVVNYTMAHKMDVDLSMLENPGHPDRQKYLDRFVDAESQHYLWRYWNEQKDKTPDQLLALMAAKTQRTPVHLAVIFRTLHPGAPYEQMVEFFRRECPGFSAEKDYTDEFEKYGPGKFDLNDQGYIISTHPLALWLAAERIRNPALTWDQAVAESADERRFVYKWLYKPHKIKGQNRRILTMLEKEAFDHIHASWKEKGFPFDKMTPSLASALGASGDTPAALAELSGIIQASGLRKPVIKFEEISFGENTPYEMHFVPDPAPPRQVMPPEVAQTALNAMRSVAKDGTARRLDGATVLSSGLTLPIGGKTGTGDNRLKSFARGGGLTGSAVKSRTATFVFNIGDRFYGSLIAYVPGEDAAKFRFTSALPVQTLKTLLPAIQPLLERSYGIEHPLPEPQGPPKPEKPATKKPARKVA